MTGIRRRHKQEVSSIQSQSDEWPEQRPSREGKAAGKVGGYGGEESSLKPYLLVGGVLKSQCVARSYRRTNALLSALFS